MHHPSYSSGLHGSIERMQWPYAEWGADVVISGHNHTYERISRDGITYFVNGLGGKSKYPFFLSVDGSQVRYNQDYGAMMVEASEIKIRFQFINRQGDLIDSKDLIHIKSAPYYP
jgi:predicted phosphodiesterase